MAYGWPGEQIDDNTSRNEWNCLTPYRKLSPPLHCESISS